MSKEYIFELDDALYNEETGEACFNPVIKDELIRCKDCKHRPKKPDYYEDGFDLEFPDGICPCQCEDGYYSWYPQDDWYCADGKRRK